MSHCYRNRTQFSTKKWSKQRNLLNLLSKQTHCFRLYLQTGWFACRWAECSGILPVFMPNLGDKPDKWKKKEETYQVSFLWNQLPFCVCEPDILCTVGSWPATQSWPNMLPWIKIGISMSSKSFFFQQWKHHSVMSCNIFSMNEQKTQTSSFCTENLRVVFKEQTEKQKPTSWDQHQTLRRHQQLKWCGTSCQRVLRKRDKHCRH